MEGRAPEPPRRQRAVALPRPKAPIGAAARAVPSRRSFAVGLALAAGAALAFVVARQTPLFALRTVTVEGAPAAVAWQVRAALEPLEGSSLVTLDGEDVVRRVEALPTVIFARYDREFPHGLQVVVRPERPVVVLRQGSDAWLASARGRVMRRLRPGTERAFPRIWLNRTTVIALGVRLDGEPARTAAALSVLAASPLAGRVTTARLEDGRLTLVLRSGLELLIGRPTALALKLAVADRVLNTGPSGQVAGYLDVAVPERPVGKFNSQVAD